jgi:polar amino acid transport system substrate-binding protein
MEKNALEMGITKIGLHVFKHNVSARAMYEKLGYEGEIVSNGKKAVEKALTEDFDICLMDIHMPIMSGIEATEEIRKKGNTTLPIVALTADVFKEGKDRCLEAGMNDFLSRPVKREKLEQKIAEWTN